MSDEHRTHQDCAGDAIQMLGAYLRRDEAEFRGIGRMFRGNRYAGAGVTSSMALIARTLLEFISSKTGDAPEVILRDLAPAIHQDAMRDDEMFGSFSPNPTLDQLLRDDPPGFRFPFLRGEIGDRLIEINQLLMEVDRVELSETGTSKPELRSLFEIAMLLSEVVELLSDTYGTTADRQGSE